VIVCPLLTIHDNLVQKKSQRDTSLNTCQRKKKKRNIEAFGVPVYKKDWFALIQCNTHCTGKGKHYFKTRISGIAGTLE
jgi:hypothetical protein